MVDGRSLMRQLCSCLLSVGVVAVGLASCNSTDNTTPMTRGGPGDVVTLNHDAGHADARHDAAMPAAAGPSMGAAKTTLCQALLKCVHQTSCPGPDDEQLLLCYCGTGTDIETCTTSSGFVPTGPCEAEVAAALEVTQISSAEHFTQ